MVAPSVLCVRCSISSSSEQTFTPGPAPLLSARMVISFVLVVQHHRRNHVWMFVGYELLDFLLCVCRVEDYWIGYKLFCFAYYSNSHQHEAEFEHSKLGGFIAYIVFAYYVCAIPCLPRFLWDLPLNAYILHCFWQDNLCGDATCNCPGLPVGHSAPLACTCFLLWKCFVSGSCRKIATIFNHSCIDLTPRRIWNPMNWVDLFYS